MLSARVGVGQLCISAAGSDRSQLAAPSTFGKIRQIKTTYIIPKIAERVDQEERLKGGQLLVRNTTTSTCAHLKESNLD